MKTDVTLRKLEIADLPDIAAVHMGSFPDSTLTKLGSSIVERYYSWHLTGPHKKVLATGAFIGDECVGFSFSGIFNGSLSGFIRQNKMALIREVILNPQYLLDPVYQTRIRTGLRILWRFIKKKPSSAGTHRSQSINYGILSIAVSKNHQKAGIGQLLMRNAQDEALRSGHNQICLTVHPENVEAVTFYEKQNWHKTRQNGLWRGAMVKDLK